MELPPPSSPKSLQCTIGLFAYYSKWIHKFSYKIKPLSDCKVFPTEGEALPAFENLEKELGEVALHRVSHSGGGGGGGGGLGGYPPPHLTIFSKPPPPPKPMPPMKQFPPPHLKMEPPISKTTPLPIET